MSSGVTVRRPILHRVAHALPLVLLACLLAVLGMPRAFGMHGLPGVSHLIALRGVFTVAVLGVALLLIALPWRRRLLPVTVVLLLGAATHVAVLADRGTTGLWSAPGDRGDTPDDALVVLTLNTHGGVSASDLTDLLVDRRADVLVLPETTRTTADEVAELAAQRGRYLQVLAHRSGRGVTASTALLVDRDLGTYRIEDVVDGSLATFTAVELTGSGPPITAAHPGPPVGRSFGVWQSLTTAAVEPCRARAGIVAGDLNATLDHPAFDDLGTCVDALADAGAGGVGTWPAALPRALGAPIDHVLVDGREWRVLEASVLDAPDGTDHRAVEAVLVPAG
jgi:hypothetical protein